MIIDMEKVLWGFMVLDGIMGTGSVTVVGVVVKTRIFTAFHVTLKVWGFTPVRIFILN